MEFDHHKTDVVPVFPASTASALMHAENIGRWLFLCQVADHLSGGMFSFYNVNKCKFTRNAKLKRLNRPKLSGKIREYYIAVVEEPWAYAQTDENKYDGGNLTNGER